MAGLKLGGGGVGGQGVMDVCKCNCLLRACLITTSYESVSFAESFVKSFIGVIKSFTGEFSMFY